eukprot:TRINITY_DN26571_c1_g1_i1.p1 TRINITY_DN26571_c1_g1~~TRINITY_DN26571_c1_g1_i1.p1  ORF type:complete len:212 (+),score=90.99 TRINITY_DN26571_c1_g1_i1:78-713(+)
MPKVQRARRKLHDRAPAVGKEAEEEDDDEEQEQDANEEQEAEEEGDDTQAGASRGQRKRQKRREGFMRKFEFVNFVQKQEEVRRNGGLGDLSSLAGTLKEAMEEGSRQRAGSVKRMTRKAEAAATEREIAQYQGVLGVGAFQQDPLGALEQHLRNSIQRQKDTKAAGASAAAAKAAKAAAEPAVPAAAEPVQLGRRARKKAAAAAVAGKDA